MYYFQYKGEGMQKIFVGLFLLGIIVPSYATEPPKVIKFKNNVTYDHEGHKGICNSCHDSLSGANKIAGFGKEWAHKNCIGCHTTMGSGPTTCSDCHKKQ